MQGAMTPLQRVTATLEHDTPDRVPVVLFFMSAAQHGMFRDDMTWNELLHSPYKLSRLVAQQHELYGIDNLFLPLDFRVAGEAFGGQCEYSLKCGGGMRMPVIKEFPLRHADGIDALEVPDPRTAGRCPAILKAMGSLSAKYGGRVPLVGFLTSPLDTATDILAGGYSALLPLLATDPQATHRLLRKVTEFQIEFGKAMEAAGANALATVGGGFNNLTIGPPQFQEFVSPYISRMVAATGVPLCFHQCQDATPFLAEMVGTGAAAIAFHEHVDLAAAKKNFGGKVVLAGNVAVSGARSIMASGTTSEVERSVRRTLEIGKPGGMFWLSAGCEVHHALGEENIHALVRSAEKYGRY
jgi:uroporphyrinogen decarboxylase